MNSHYKITVSQTPASGYADMRTENKSIFDRLVEYTDRFWNSRLYYPLILGIAALFMFTGHEIAGMVVMAAFAIYIQFTLPDLMAAILPAVLFLLIGTKYYNDLGYLLRLWWVVPIFAASFVFNFLRWPVHLRRGACWGSLAAVSFAALFGGVGVIPAREYFSLYGFMYGFGLGGGMLLASVLYGTNLARPRSYDACARFAGILYAVGIFTGLVVINYYVSHRAEITPESRILYIQFRNYLTTMLVLALPMPFRFVSRSRLHLAAVAFMYAALLLTGSRSGLVFGTVILFASAFFTVMSGKTLSKKSIPVIAAFSVTAAVVIFALGQTVLNSRLVDGTLFPVTDSRVMFLRQSVMDFLSNPMNGIGLANMQNSKIFLGVGGSMVWYHNYFAQIIGSMGIVGICAYGWLLGDRYRYLKTLHTSGETMLALGFLGILMVSMTNPGEFCPLPNEFLVVVLFNVAETVRAARAEATVSGETSYVVWAPARGRVKLGVYSNLSNTVSLAAGTKPLVVLPEYAEHTRSTGSVGIYDRSGEARS